jgi:hypothetical protein
VVAGLGEWELSSSNCDVAIHRSFCLLGAVDRYLRGLKGMEMVVACSLLVVRWLRGLGRQGKEREGKGLKEERQSGGKLVWLGGLRDRG